MSLASLMIHVVDIERLTEAKDSSGFVTSSWVSRKSGIMARVDQASSNTVIAYGRLGLTVTHRVYCNEEHDWSIKDRVKFQGKYYEVRNIENVAGHINRLWQIDCEAKVGT